MKHRALTALALSILMTACGGAPPDESPSTGGTGSPPEPDTELPSPLPPAPTPAPVKPAPACDPYVPRATPLALAVQPDVGAEPFVAVIDRAKKSLRVMVYQMGFGPILEGLEAKAKAGVKVRVILDLAQKGVNQKYMDRLKAAGAEVLWSDPQFTFMHAKVIVADEAEAAISTGNYHVTYINKERNFTVRDSDPADLATLVEIFEADWARRAPDVSCTRLLVAPVNARQRLLDFIASAKSELLVHSMQLGDRDVRDAVIARKKAGVDVRALLADPDWIEANRDAAALLEQHGIPARHMPHVHVKAIVADGAAYVGSINLSYTSLTKNREVGLIVTEPANLAAIRTTFEKDWKTATSF